MRRSLAILATLAMAAPAFAAQCPMDRTTFVEKTTKAEFVGEKVAVAYRYLCPGRKADRVYNTPQKKLEEKCSGPFGETYVSGTLAGKPVIAMYTEEKAAPCCYWRTYAADDKEMKRKRFKWLTADVRTVEIGSTWLTIGPDNPPWPPDTGPLKGGTYVPMVCRAK